MLDHLRVQMCLQSIGRYIQVLVFRPISNFYNLYEFMNMISFYAEHGYGVGSRISTLQYTFPCNMATSRVDESVLYGTGGSYLSSSWPSSSTFVLTISAERVSVNGPTTDIISSDRESVIVRLWDDERRRHITITDCELRRHKNRTTFKVDI